MTHDGHACTPQPLMWAVLNGHTSTVALLLEFGAKVDAQSVPERVHRSVSARVYEWHSCMYGCSCVCVCVCVCVCCVCVCVCVLVCVFAHVPAHVSMDVHMHVSAYALCIYACG
jgi:hypothetical protein